MIKSVTKPFRFKVLQSFQDKSFFFLDVGCGNNGASKAKRFFPNCKYYGVDMNRSYNNQEVNFSMMEEFFELNLDNSELTEIPDNFFDLIVISHVVEHLYHGLDIIQKLISKLKIGGKIYIETPHVASLGLSSMSGTLNFSDDFTHVRIYTIEEISNVLMEKKCTVIKAKRRRDWIRILATPLNALHCMLTKRNISSAYWDITGFAFYVYAERKY